MATSLAAEGGRSQLAKIALLAREFQLDERFRPEGSPFIYRTLINAAAFALLLFLFKLLEEAAVGLYHGKTAGKHQRDRSR